MSQLPGALASRSPSPSEQLRTEEGHRLALIRDTKAIDEFYEYSARAEETGDYSFLDWINVHPRTFAYWRTANLVGTELDLPLNKSEPIELLTKREGSRIGSLVATENSTPASPPATSSATSSNEASPGTPITKA